LEITSTAVHAQFTEFNASKVPNKSRCIKGNYTLMSFTSCMIEKMWMDMHSSRLALGYACEKVMAGKASSYFKGT
jgi:hypothetical protein